MDNDNEEAPASPKVAAAKERYAAFLLANPQSRIVAFESEGDERLIVSRPWGDRSLAFAIPDDDEELVAALKGTSNNSPFPARSKSDSRMLNRRGIF